MSPPSNSSPIPRDRGDLAARTAALSLEQKVRLLTGADFWSLHPEPAVGLRRLVVSDGPAGVRGERWDERDTSANVPSPTALAATWDEALVEELGRLLAFESRRKGVDVLLAPTVNLHRTPYGGRHFECFSEDPLLTARIGVAYVRGVQAGGVGATVKHFVANDSETQRMTPRRAGRRARAAGALPRPVRGDRARGRRVVGHGRLQRRQRAADDREPAAARHPARRVGLRRGRHVGLVRHPHDGAVRQRGARPGDAGARRAVGRRAGRRRARGRGRRGGDRRQGRAHPAAGGPRRRARRRAAGAAPELGDAEVAATLRRAAAAGFVLARNEGAVLPLDRSALARVAVVGPERRRGADARRWQRDRVPALHGLAARRAARRARRGRRGRARHRRHAEQPHPRRGPAVDAPPGRRRRGRGALRRRRRHGAGDRGARPGCAFTWMGSFGHGDRDRRRRARRGAHRRARDGRRGPTRSRARASAATALSVGGEQVFDDELELPPGRGHRRGHHDPAAGDPQRRPRRGRERRGRARARGRLDDERRRRPRRDCSSSTSCRRTGATTRRSSGRCRSPATPTSPWSSSGRRRRSRARASIARRSRCRGARTSSCAAWRRRIRRTVVVVNAGAPVLLPWADEVAAILLAWFPGQEFGNALADVLAGARRARRPAADELAERRGRPAVDAAGRRHR